MTSGGVSEQPQLLTAAEQQRAAGLLPKTKNLVGVILAGSPAATMRCCEWQNSDHDNRSLLRADPLIEFGKVLATMHQRPYTQGKIAFESLVAHLRKEDQPESVVRLAQHVIFCRNLSLFPNSIIDTDGELETALMPSVVKK